jgi:hypothetical protein
VRKIFPFIIALPLVLLSCTSTNDSFLLKSLDDQSKAQALTREGVQQYELYIKARHEFDRIPQIKELFTVALKYDPSNTLANQYVALLDNTKNQKVQTNLANATKELAKPKRTDDDDYTLYVSLQSAASIDPSNQKVQKMLSDTAQDRARLVDSYVQKSKASMSAITDKTPQTIREKQCVDAYQSAYKAFEIDPNSAAAQAQLSEVKGEIAKIVAAHSTAIQKLVAGSKFPDARAELAALNELNRRTSHSFDADVSTASYSLNYSWAKWLYVQKDYGTAEVKVDAALAVKRSAEASALERKIAAAKPKADADASYEVAIQDIDRLIGDEELVSAHHKIDYLAKVTVDQTKLAALDERRQTITGKLKDIYDRGVQAYHDEDFKTAIDLLQTVVSVQVDYEQAGDYLDKARSKQKVLDQLK